MATVSANTTDAIGQYATNARSGTFFHIYVQASKSERCSDAKTVSRKSFTQSRDVEDRVMVQIKHI